MPRQHDDPRFATAIPQVIPTFERPVKPTPLENEVFRDDGRSERGARVAIAIVGIAGALCVAGMIVSVVWAAWSM